MAGIEYGLGRFGDRRLEKGGPRARGARRRPCSCIRRLAGKRSKEMQFTRFLRNASVTAAEMSAHAAAGTAARAAAVMSWSSRTPAN